MVDDNSALEEKPETKTASGSCAYRFLKRILVVGFVLFVIALVAGYCYEASERSRIAAELLPPGKMVGIGGRKLHLHIQGQGSPTVVLEGGSGGGTLEWTLVAHEVAKVTRVVSYDRAGVGWSEPSSSPKTGDVAVNELRTALEAQGIGGPLILVGHSLGGHYVRMFYYRHPEDVAGLVLVDGAHEEQRSRLPEEFIRRMNELGESMTFAAKISKFGLPRIMMETQGIDEVFPELSLLPETSRSAWLQLAPGAMQTFAEEFNAFDETCEQVKEAAVPLEELPLAVISSSKAPFGFSQGYMKVWMEMQSELAALSKNGTQRVVEDSGHFIQIERPDVVIEEVVSMVKNFRNSTAESK